MIVSRLEDVLAFLETWTGRPATYPGQFDGLPDDIPAAIRTLNDSLGAFWTAKSYPLTPEHWDHNTERGLMGVQDTIHAPHDHRPDNDGICTLITENQGCWAFGYAVQSHQSFAFGAWHEDTSAPEDTWRATDMSVEDALIQTLLMHIFFDFDPRREGPSSGDAATDHLLWRDPTCPDLAFWTNSDRTAFRFADLGTITRPRTVSSGG